MFRTFPVDCRPLFSQNRFFCPAYASNFLKFPYQNHKGKSVLICMLASWGFNPETSPNLSAEKAGSACHVCCSLTSFFSDQFWAKNYTFYEKNIALCYLRKRRKSTKIRACEHWGIGRNGQKEHVFQSTHVTENVRCVIQGLVRLD